MSTVITVNGGNVVKDGVPTLSNTCVLNMQHTFADGRVMAGDFVVRRLTVGDVGKVAVRKAQLNGSLPDDTVGETTNMLHQMLAHLEIAIVKAPDWWRPLEFFESDPITALYEKVLDFELSFRAPARAGQAGDQAPRES